MTPGGDGVVGDVNALPYHFKNLDTGEEVSGENLNAFCNSHAELNRDCMYRVKNGKQKLHKKWYCPECCSEEEAKLLGEPYQRSDLEAQSPDTTKPEESS